jgi:hypothetical protein
MEASSTMNLGLLVFKTLDDEQLPGGANNMTAPSIVNVITFMEPYECAYPQGCGDAWSEYGVGVYRDGFVQWCCTAEAVQAGLCITNDESQQQVGQLIVDETKVNSAEGGIIHRMVSVPSIGSLEEQLPFVRLEGREAGPHVVLIANCNDQGRPIQVLGPIQWEGGEADLSASEIDRLVSSSEPTNAPVQATATTTPSGGSGAETSSPTNNNVPVESPTMSPTVAVAGQGTPSLSAPGVMSGATLSPVAITMTFPGDKSKKNKSGPNWWPLVAVVVILALLVLFVQERKKHERTRRELMYEAQQQRELVESYRSRSSINDNTDGNQSLQSIDIDGMELMCDMSNNNTRSNGSYNNIFNSYSNNNRDNKSKNDNPHHGSSMGVALLTMLGVVFYRNQQKQQHSQNLQKRSDWDDNDDLQLEVVQEENDDEDSDPVPPPIATASTTRRASFLDHPNVVGSPRRETASYSDHLPSDVVPPPPPIMEEASYSDEPSAHVPPKSAFSDFPRYEDKPTPPPPTPPQRRQRRQRLRPEVIESNDPPTNPPPPIKMEDVPLEINLMDDILSRVEALATNDVLARTKFV